MTTEPNPHSAKPNGAKPSQSAQPPQSQGRPLPKWIQRAMPEPGTKPMLPGMALISIYLLVLAMLNAFAAAAGKFGMGSAKYSVLAICTLLAIGVFGLLRLRRWGWAIVTAGSLLMAAGYFYGFHRTHIAPYIIQGLFAMVFFLYLSRADVRERLH